MATESGLTSEDQRQSSDVESLWAPFRETFFRWLWIASVASNVGTWLQNVGAAWLMTELTSSSFLIALVQAATTLPVFLFSLPAGAIADVFDRRRVMLAAQIWMLVIAGLLAVGTYLDAMTPMLLLAMTFALGTGAAIYNPAWQAVVPSLVPRRQLRSAVTLNSISMNASRAVGPAIGGVLVAIAGAETGFLLNSLSFIGVIVVLWFWKRERAPGATIPPEPLFGAMGAGLRFVRHAPRFRAILWRAIGFVTGASAVWALLPVVARDYPDAGPSGYGSFLASMGAGAILGTGAITSWRARLGSQWTVTIGSLIFGACASIFALGDFFWLRCAVLLIAGSMWMSVMTTLNSSAQSLLPEWVRARAISVYLLVFFGGMAFGSMCWGAVAQEFGSTTALVAAGCWMAVTAAITHGRAPSEADESQGNVALSHHWSTPPAVPADRLSSQALVSIEYHIPAERLTQFLTAIRELRQSRLRGGAREWSLHQDIENPERYIELFTERSWADHLRRHERVTEEDRRVQDAVNACHRGETPPRVSHLLSIDTARPPV